MNLQPVNPSYNDPARVGQRVMCSCCLHMSPVGRMKADLDAQPGTYVCEACEADYASDDIA